jgi:hypothetical protein
MSAPVAANWDVTLSCNVMMAATAPKKGRGGEIGRCASAPQMSQRKHEQCKTHSVAQEANDCCRKARRQIRHAAARRYTY